LTSVSPDFGYPPSWIGLGSLIAASGKSGSDRFDVGGGIDATEDALVSMKAGDLEVTVFQDAAGQGKGAIDAALKLAKEEKIDRERYMPFQLVTPANMDAFLKRN
jgi:inositol transport system substrate-binding protein